MTIAGVNFSIEMSGVYLHENDKYDIMINDTGSKIIWEVYVHDKVTAAIIASSSSFSRELLVQWLLSNNYVTI